MDPVEDAPQWHGNAFCAHPTIGGVPLENLAPPVDIKDPSPNEIIRVSFSSRSSHTPPTLVPVVLHISPSHDGGPSGCVYLDVYKLNDQAAIMAYFANTGRVMTVLLCQNFNEFFVSNSLGTRQVSFLPNLPASIITMGQRILAVDAASEEAGRDRSWLPCSPLMSSATLLSHPARTAPCSANITTRVGTGRAPCSFRMDLDGFEAPPAPFFVPVGGPTCFQVFSPITMSLATGDFCFTRTESPQRNYILTQFYSAAPRPSSSMSSSSDSLDLVTCPPPPAPAPSTTSIKDKPSDLGIKHITNKES